ncbi:hypothetical protein Y032_0255g311 [Ancylostoma ceylanicum]|uniref:Uncharacterized protein n=1 Tax=Ancylostoma ceylanicum TaxID=53326 RepID=A0A016SC61_9BILA|nr:hypothetical protein Y032_0255g311 [Ancylostoma ceylanicum]
MLDGHRVAGQSQSVHFCSYHPRLCRACHENVATIPRDGIANTSRPCHARSSRRPDFHGPDRSDDIIKVCNSS